MDPSTNSRFLTKAHGRLGLAFSCFLLLSAGSGLLHLFMGRLEPQVPARSSKVHTLNPEKLKLSLPEAAGKARETLGIGSRDSAILMAAVCVVERETCWQILFQGTEKPVYVNGETGAVHPRMDEEYARQIAAEFLGDPSMTKTDYLTRFNREYTRGSRILPVYRFDCGDGRGTRVYVSTLQKGVVRSTNDRRQFLATLFGFLHEFKFIPNKNARDLALATVTTGVLVAAALGVALSFRARPGRARG
ncbi:MAG: hypothetical protein IT578_10500 [Verrucomicrobiae bacterium]|nr:hypothetical protein [Verrucomicrobiae bacterium]